MVQKLGAGRSDAAEALCGHLIKQMATGTQYSRSIAGELRSLHDRQIEQAGWMGLHIKYLMHAKVSASSQYYNIAIFGALIAQEAEHM